VIANLTQYGAQARMGARERKMIREASMAAGRPQPNLPADPMQAQLRKVVLGDYLTMNAAVLDSALATSSPFADRLVYFWANHFAVSIDKLPVIPIAGLLEFEAIRRTCSAASPTCSLLPSSIRRCADWPGVSPAALYEGRDLKPTTGPRFVDRRHACPALRP
jgi:uncharacterized protein (DUF1800 family)